jgi:hypothetical protein
MAKRWPSAEKLASANGNFPLAIVPSSIHPHMDNRRMHDDHWHDWNEHCRVVVMSSAVGDNAAGSGEQCDGAD